MKTGGKRLGNNRGSVINLVLLILLAATIAGVVAVAITSTDQRITRNLKVRKTEFYTAEAGIEEAKARLMGTSTRPNYAGDPAGANLLWSAYLSSSASWQTSSDPEYNGAYQNYFPVPGGSKTATAISANSMQSTLPYFVKIRHKREYDAEQAGHTSAKPHYNDLDGSTAAHSAASPGSIIYYGFATAAASTGSQFTTATTADGKPVEIVTAYSTGDTNRAVLRAEVYKSLGPKVVAAVYAQGNVTGNGSSMSVNGNDNCGVAAAVPPIYTMNPAVTNINGNPTLAGNPATPVTGPTNIDIDGMVAGMRGGATQILTADMTANGSTIGSSSNYVTAYSDTSNPFNVGGLKLQNVTGYGTLLVQGDLELGGNVNWNGVILVTGTITFNGGGGGINVRGAVLGSQTIDINGGLDIRYDSCKVDEAGSGGAVRVLNWYGDY